MIRSFVHRLVLSALAAFAFLAPVPSEAFIQGRYTPVPSSLSVPVLPTAAIGSDLPTFVPVPEGEFACWKSCRNDPVSFNDPMGLTPDPVFNALLRSQARAVDKAAAATGNSTIIRLSSYVSSMLEQAAYNGSPGSYADAYESAVRNTSAVMLQQLDMGAGRTKTALVGTGYLVGRGVGYTDGYEAFSGYDAATHQKVNTLNRVALWGSALYKALGTALALKSSYAPDAQPTPSSCPDKTLVSETPALRSGSDIVYRRLHPAERSTALTEGLSPRSHSADITPEQHVLGARETPYISATRDYDVALGYNRNATPIVEIDLSKVPAETVDFTEPATLSTLTERSAIYNATRDAEVLIKGRIPPEAIGKIHYP